MLTDHQTDIEPPSHHPGTATERLAAHLVRPRAGILRAHVLDAFIAAADGLTDHELSEATGKYLYTVAPRRGELLMAGWVENSGRRRLTPHGRHAIVWQLTPQARFGVTHHV
jgi:hypothetical protein